jgi:predicted phosphodiesterase
MAIECWDLLRKLDVPIHYIKGNGEDAILADLAGTDQPRLPPQVRQTIRWLANQLNRDQQAELSRWPNTIQLEIEPLGQILFCHATPRSNIEIFTSQTAESALLLAFATTTANFVICGHTHMQFDRTIKGLRVINAGSIGMPFGTPGADWLLLGPDIQLRHTNYDLPKAAERIRQTTSPSAEQFAQNDVLNPRSETEALALFATVEMKDLAPRDESGHVN